MHQKHSTSATKSGTSRTSFHGRKLSSSAPRNDSRMVLTRTGRRMCCGLSGPIAVLAAFLTAVLRAVLRFARLVGSGLALQPSTLVEAAVLRGLHIVRTRRRLGVVDQHEHVAPAVDAGGGFAQDENAREAVLGVALDALDESDGQSRRIRAVDAGGD